MRDCQWLGNSDFHSQISFPLSQSCEFPLYPCSQQCQLGLHSSHFGACIHRSFLFSLKLEPDVSKMLPQSSKKLPRKSWRPHKMLPGPAFPHHIPPLAHGQNLWIPSLPITKRVFTKTLRTVWKSTGCCLFSVCVTQKRVRSLNVTKKLHNRLIFALCLQDNSSVIPGVVSVAEGADFDSC